MGHYPVIKFSFSGGDYNEKDGLAQTLGRILEKYEREYAINAGTMDLPNRFAVLIETMQASTGQSVVVLVDEYDKPLRETMIVNPEQEEYNRRLFKAFFSILKDEDQYLKFVFFTGVTKFSKVSIFSDINQLIDISFRDDYAGICGITEKELREDLNPEVERLRKTFHITKPECLQQLANMYDGYRFSVKGIRVFNPYSVLGAFGDQDFGFYWFETGTPTFLINQLKALGYTFEQLHDGVAVQEQELKNYQPESDTIVPLLYQSGYLTIDSYDPQFRIFELKFPNREVEFSFFHSITEKVFGSTLQKNPWLLRNLILDLQNGRIDSFMESLKTLFAGVPYPDGQSMSYEREWRDQIYLILTLLGENVQCEVHSSTGRADCVIKTSKFIYILEYKMDHSADEALRQIEDKGYAKAYGIDQRQLIKVGISFSSKTRNINEWKYKKVQDYS